MLMDIFQQRLKEIRIEKGVSQVELARLVQTTNDSIYSWEKGRSQPSVEAIRRLCRALGVSADYLLGLEREDGTKEYDEF